MKLVEFDKEFFESLKGKDSVKINERGIYHTIIIDDRKAGAVGFIPGEFDDMGFVQVIIAPEFSGRGLVGEAEDMLAGRHSLKELYATIKKDNIASIKAHEKADFQYIPKSTLEDLRKKGFLKDYDIRMVKKYKNNN